MSRVAGLSPIERTGPSGVERADSRAQTAPNRPAPDLQPRAAVNNVYAHPEDNTAAAGSDLRQLASALGQLNPALNNFAGTYTDEAKLQQEQAAQNKIGGMTFEEAKKGVEEGSISELQNPWFRAAFMKQYGQRVALKKAQELTNQYENGFQKDGGDVEKLVADTAKPVLQQYGNDRHFSAGFNGVFAPQAAKIKAEQAGYQSQRVNTEVRQGVFEIGMAQIGQGMERGDTSDQIVSNLRSTYAGNKQLLNVQYGEQDAEVFRIAETLTKGINTSANPKLQKEIVEKLLNDERFAPDGKNLGSLAKNRTYASKAVTLLDAADKELRQYNRQSSFDSFSSWDELSRNGQINDAMYEKLKQEHADNPGRFRDEHVVALKARSDAALEVKRAEVAALEEKNRARQLADAQHNAVINSAYTLAGQGHLWSVKDTEVLDENGKTKTMKGKDVQEEVTSQFLKKSKRIADDRHEAPEQTLDREVKWLGQNNQENPEWTDLLKAGYMQGTAASLSGTKLPKDLEAASDLYAQLYAKNPQLLKKHIDDDAMTFYEGIRFGTQVAGFDKRTAAINALEVTKDPTKYDSPYWKQKHDDIAAAVKKTLPGFMMNGAPGNESEIAPVIEKTAKYFSHLGAPPTVAVEEAKKRVALNYVDVNDYLVRIDDRSVPPSFPDLAKRYIEGYVAKYGEKEHVSAADLTVQPFGNGAGQWRLVMKKSPGMVVNHPDGIFDMAKLHAFEQTRLEAERVKAMDSANEKLNLKSGERSVSMKVFGLTENSSKADANTKTGAVDALGTKIKSGVMGAFGLTENSLKPDETPIPSDAFDGTKKLLRRAKNAL